jgi:hypothetical protein
VSPFAQHEVEPKDRSKLEPERKPLSAQELLAWLKHRGKAVVSLRDVQIYGPCSIRDRKSAITHLEALVDRGWLVELKPFRRDRRVWSLPPAMMNAKN